MADEILITVPGKPVAWQRAGHNGKTGHFYTRKQTSSFETQAAAEAMVAMKGRQLFTGPVCVRWTAYFGIPPSWAKWKRKAALDGSLRHTSTPDADNLLKMKDAFKGVVWKDDSQVIAASVSKEYAAIPRTDILIFSAPGVPSQITRRDQLPATREAKP